MEESGSSAGLVGFVGWDRVDTGLEQELFFVRKTEKP